MGRVLYSKKTIKQNMITKITHNDKILGIIIPTEYSKDGIDFFTPDDFSIWNNSWFGKDEKKDQDYINR